MKSGLKVESDPRPILACTVCRDVQNFDLLIVDMEEVMGDQWGDLGFSDALTFFDQAEAQHLEFIALAIDDLEARDGHFSRRPTASPHGSPLVSPTWSSPPRSAPRSTAR